MTLPKISSFIIRTISIDDWSKHICKLNYWGGGVGICGVYVNSSIVNEGILVETSFVRYIRLKSTLLLI